MRSEERKHEVKPRMTPLINNFVNDGIEAKEGHNLETSVHFKTRSRPKTIKYGSRRSRDPKSETDSRQSEKEISVEDTNSKRQPRVPRLSSEDMISEDAGQDNIARSDLDTVTKDVEKNDPVRPQQAWLMFEDSIKKMGDTTQCVAKKNSHKNFKASDTFSQVMVDLFGNEEYSRRPGRNAKFKDKVNVVRKTATLASRLMAKVHEKEKQKVKEESIEETDSVFTENEENVFPDQCVETAKRGWSILKRHVQDTSLENKTSESTMKWKMLSQHMKNMSDVDSARLDLYRRYGILPTEQKDGTFAAKNTMLSERAQNALLLSETIRPKSEKLTRSVTMRERPMSEHFVRTRQTRQRVKISGRNATDGKYSNHDLI